LSKGYTNGASLYPDIKVEPNTCLLCRYWDCRVRQLSTSVFVFYESYIPNAIYSNNRYIKLVRYGKLKRPFLVGLCPIGRFYTIGVIGKKSDRRCSPIFGSAFCAGQIIFYEDIWNIAGQSVPLS
jgi:hypothetical protein